MALADIITNRLLKKPFHGLFQLAKRKVSFSLCSILQAHKACLKNGGGTLRYALPCTAHRLFLNSLLICAVFFGF
jgi:hypothetical protein